MIKSFPGWFGLLVALVVLDGALPGVFAALVGRLVNALPAAVAGGFGSPAGHAVTSVLVGLGIVLVLQEIPAAAWVLWEDLLHRYDGHIRSRIMTAVLSVPRLELFEDPALAAQTDRAVRFVGRYPGEVVPGFAEKWSAQAQGLAGAVLVASVWPIAAMPLAGLWLLVGHRLQVDYARTEATWAENRRRVEYFKQIGTGHEWAKELRIFGLTGWIADRLGREWATYIGKLWQSRHNEQPVVLPLLGTLLAANAAVLLLATHAALGGSLSAGALAIVVQGLFAMPSLANQNSDHLIEMGSIPIAELKGLQDTAAQVPRPGGRRPAVGVPVREIRFDRVQFGYPNTARPVYDDLNLRIEAGRSLGLVGLNGAGKTTLIKLLAGLEIPQAGRISVDDTDLEDFDLASWHRNIAAIFQDFAHYEMSVRDNIAFGAYGRLDLSVDMVVHAARHAGADGLISSLPQGYDTILSRRFAGGVDLSGGQWQRIALARALAAVSAGARILVLDEPTAHLDARAEAGIYERFLELTRGLTTIVISHRFSTVRRADRIVVLDSGRVAEDGTHGELLASGGRYAQLFRRQAAHYTGEFHD